MVAAKRKRPAVVHSTIMCGSSGAGKTLLARALPGILPDLGLEEALEVTRIYSVADLLPAETPLLQARPFRSSHVSSLGKNGRLVCNLSFEHYTKQK
jgi:predicted ATPase with chaperone activity